MSTSSQPCGPARAASCSRTRHPAADRGIHPPPLSNTEIADRLHVSLSTAKTHIGRLLMKLGARDRAQLVIAAHDNGLVGASKPT